MMNVSAIVITYNEELNIESCLRSLSFVEEVIVVDSNSTDRTVEIAQRYTDRVFIKPWEGYASAKNFGISQARFPWVLCIDADERVSELLQKSIQSAMDREELPAGYYCSRRTWYLNRWIRGSGWYPDWCLRLFDSRKGRFKDVIVHESVELNGKAEYLNGDLLHYSYRDISQHAQRIDNYTRLIAQKWVQENRPITLLRMIIRPVWEFFRKLIIKKGFLDGIPGWIIAGMHAYYIFLKYAKTYELRLKMKDHSES